MTHFPGWLDAFDRWLTGGCFRLEGVLGLPSGCVADLAGDMLTRLADAGKSAAMPFLMTNSLSVAGWLAKAAVVGLVTFLAAVLSLEEMEDLRDRRGPVAVSQGVQSDRDPAGTDGERRGSKPRESFSWQ